MAPAPPSAQLPNAFNRSCEANSEASTHIPIAMLAQGLVGTAMHSDVWLSTLHRLHYGRASRVDPSLAAQSAFVQRSLKAHGLQGEVASTASVCALVQLQATAVIHPMLVLTDHEREQLRCWQHLTGNHLESPRSAFLFRVLRKAKLPAAEPVQKYSSAKMRGLVVSLEEFQGPALLGRLRAAGHAQDWLPHAAPQVAVRLPAAYVCLLVAGMWQTFVLPCVQVGRRAGSSSTGISWALLGLPMPASTAPPEVEQVLQHLPVESRSLLSDNAGVCALQLRLYASTLPRMDEFDQEHYKVVVEAVLRLQNFSDDMDEGGASRLAKELRHHAAAPLNDQAPCKRSQMRQYKASFLLHCCLMAHLLRDQQNLVKAIRVALRLLVAPALMPAFLSLIESMEKVMPHAATMSKWRCLIDGALMLHMRSCNDRLRDQGQGMVRFIMADSSEQRGRQFELMVVIELRRAVLPALMLAFCELVRLWDDVVIDVESEDFTTRVRAEKPLMQQLAKELVLKHLPIITLASGGLKLRDKFRAVMYAMFLLASNSVAGFFDYVNSVKCLTSDMGVEFSLNTVVPVPVRQVFPWLQGGRMGADADANPHPQGVDEWEEAAEPVDPFDTEIGFLHGLSAPGPLHIIHNCAMSLLVAVPRFDEAIGPMGDVCNMIRQQTTRQRLCETCFASNIGRQFHPQLKRFSGKVHRDRWGMISYALEQLLDLERPLRTFWSVEAYRGNCDRTEQMDAVITTIHEAIDSKQWWGMLTSLFFLFRVFKEALEWTESCRCHGDLDWDLATAERRHAWAHCPCRAHRLPEIAAGDLLRRCAQGLARRLAELYVALGTDLTTEERAECIRAFSAGRAHVMCILTLKLSAFEVPPLLVFAGAHYLREVSVRALRVCMTSGNMHSMLVDLRQPPLSLEAQEYVEGAHLHELPLLCEFLSTLLWSFGAERMVEEGLPHPFGLLLKVMHLISSKDSIAVRA